jgi:serine/threonine protein kinase
MRLVRLVRDASLAVHYAHQQGLVHRDIKPQNLMVAAGDQVTLAPGVDEDLARIVMDCLEKDPGLRPETAFVLSRRLSEWLARFSVPGR